MSTVNQKMTAIADAVREKTGQTEPLTLDDLASAISIYTTDANATSNDILEGMNAYVNNQLVQGTMPNNGNTSQSIGYMNDTVSITKGYYDNSNISINWQNLTIEPKEMEQIYYPDENKAFRIINCNPIPDSYLTQSEIISQNALLDLLYARLNGLTQEENVEVQVTLHCNSDNDNFLIQYIDNNMIPHQLILHRNNSEIDITVLKNSIIYITSVNENRIISTLMTQNTDSSDIKIYSNKSIVACQIKKNHPYIIINGGDIT